ncbi:MAG: hypothetical protein AAF829_12340 [Pseudomonadota bacterium]
MIEITRAEEHGDVVEIEFVTDIETPFKVMASVSLEGQADDDIWIGNNARHTINASGDTLTVRTSRGRDPLPTGTYEAEISFYPRWGADESPESTQAIPDEIHATRTLQLTGSGESAAVMAERDRMQNWVMLNTAIGDPFNLSSVRAQLGDSEAIEVTNRTGIIVAHYFPRADMTLFENTSRGTLVTWREGRQNRL